MAKATVTVRHLQADYQTESRTKFLPLSTEMCKEIRAAVREIFESAGGKSLLKSSGDVYLKPNGIDGNPYCFTRPELVRAVIEYWQSVGARRIYLFENATQSNITRLVFEITGYAKICRETGAIPVYLDECRGETLSFSGRPDARACAGGYDGTSFEMPKFVIDRLIRDADKNLYISLPKLKTHSMAGVTLGVKNQWAFPRQRDRGYDHNGNRKYKLADVLSYVRPDFTLIEGVEGTIYGHYPVTALADECVLPLRVLIGGANVVATDLVGASVFGLTADDVPHLSVAIEKGLSGGVTGMADIDAVGDVSMYGKRYPTDLYDSFPSDVNLVFGKERACKEGCVNNPLTLLQILWNDHGGKGGWDMVMGKGHDPAVIDALKGPVLVVGHCAIDEVGDRLVKRLGKRNVFFSGKCNELAKSAAAMFYLMKVDPLSFAPLPPLTAVKCLLLAKLHGTKALVPSVLSNRIKTV